MKEKVLELLQKELDLAVKMRGYVEKSTDLTIEDQKEMRSRYDAVAFKMLQLINTMKEEL